MIRVSKYYQTVTHESAKYGDWAEAGEVYLDLEHDGAEDVIDLLEDEGFMEYSNCKTFSPDGWYKTIDGEIDYKTGDSTIYSYHLDGPIDELKAVFEAIVTSK